MPKIHQLERPLGLVLIAAGSLAFEITLTRLFAIQQFHHFAFMVVSLAVMGFAAGGALLALGGRPPSLPALSLAFSLACLAAYAILNLLPFDSYSVAWDPKQLAILLLYFAGASAPFVFAGWAIGAALSQAAAQAHRPYAASLVGSGLGCLLALGAMPLFGAVGVVWLCAGLGLLAAAAFSGADLLSVRPGTRVGLTLALLGLLILGLRALPGLFPLELSPYKPLSVARLLPDARITYSRWSATARVDVVSSASVHVYPGLSLNADAPLPAQAALFLDGDGPYPISALDPQDPGSQRLAAHFPSALAYQLRPQANALVLEPGAGLEAQLALANGAATVWLVEEQPLIVEALRGPFRAFSSQLLFHSRLELVERPGRAVLRAAGPSPDLILYSLSDPYRPVTAGAFSLSEYYPLTVQALTDAYRKLDRQGLLVITRWLGTPPSESARAWATLLAALQRSGVDEPGDRLIAFRGMRTATMMAGRQPFTESELQQTRQFLQANGFDPIWLPDLDPAELNQHNRLPEEVYHRLYADLLVRPDETIRSYEFNLRPPTDDRPFFFQYFRWRQTPQVVASLGQQWLPFGGSGYLVMLALLTLIVALAILLILTPMLSARQRMARAALGRFQIGYFACLGAGYLLIEVPLIQQLILLLDRPALALAVVLFTLLLSSGTGSALSARLDLGSSLAILAVVLVLTLILLPMLIPLALPWSAPARIALAIGLLAPSGFLMGIPFAAGLRILASDRPGTIAWCWTINGAVSGISGVLAAMVSLDWGFRAALALGVLCYLGALACCRRLSAGPSTALANRADLTAPGGSGARSAPRPG